MARSVDQIIGDALAFLSANAPDVPTSIGTVSRDVSVDAPAQEFAKVYTELERISGLQSVQFANNQTSSELEGLASNWGLTREGGNFAQGTTTFRVSNLQTFEPNIVVVAGTVIQTKQTSTTNLVSFVTTQTITFISTQAAQYFNSLTGFYELTAPIEAQAVGTSSNVPAGAITILTSSITRINSIINTTSTTGGTDVESNSALANRIRLKLSGNNIGTSNGLRSLALADSRVTDLTTVGPDDSEMLRNEFGGSVDIYILGTDNVSASDVHTFTTGGPLKFVLNRQPAVTTSGSITVSGIVSTIPYVFVEGTDYNIVADPTTLLNSSVRVQHAIKFLISGTQPDNGTSFTIAYTYNKLIADLQTIYDDASTHILGSDILVKAANRAQIDVTASISILSGFTLADIISSVQTSLTTFLNSNQLGKSFNRSDLVGIMENVVGVDQVDLSSLTINKNGSPVTSQKITINKTEYSVANTLTISSI